MSTIVFGGAGFIGTELIKRLCRENVSTTLYDRNLKSKKLPDENYNIIEGDFFLETDFRNILKGHDTIIHLISSVTPFSSMVSIEDSYQKDVVKTLEMVEAAKNEGIQKIVFVSSGGTVYGNNSSELLNEDMPCVPLNHYGIMKLTIERILLMYNKLFGMKNIILRVANPYGRGQNPEKKIGAISIFLQHVLNQEPISIYGDGEIVRDYIQISDVCQAIVSALQYSPDSYDTEPIFNIGTGVGVSLLDIIYEVENVSKIKAHINFLSERSIDVKSSILDSSKAKRYLGFEAQVSLQEGVNDLYNFLRRKI
ncbi:NAD-dependent epimerase/dehydratase family protein [Paenibacillus sp. JJ1683]